MPRTSDRRQSEWPLSGATVDLDFVAQRYWWSGGKKTTADFTTFTLSGSTFDGLGLTPSDTIDVTLALAGLGTFIPGAWAYAITQTAAPVANRAWVHLDDGTVSERVAAYQTTGPQQSLAVADGGVAQAAIFVAATSLNVRHGCCGSYATNDIKFAANGFQGTQDTVATMPTVTTLRIGREPGVAAPLGSIARVILFTAAKSQGDVNAISIAMRDNR
jgi:hypothetical protein